MDYRHRFLALTAVAIVLLTSSTALAWDGHDLITYYALREIDTLSAFDSIEITPYTYSDSDHSEYNPDFTLEYRLGEIGDKVSALDILVTYAPEPDWDLDKELDLSPFQSLTGGSQGWRHQRYTLLGGLITLGEAPERVQHFYNLAVEARAKADMYWAFRFLARAVHYLQDLGQPLHAFPLPIADFIFKYKFDIGNADAVASNVHYSIEAYYDFHLRDSDPRLISALSSNETATVGDLVEYAKKENGRARTRANRMYELVLEIWPHLDSPEEVRLTEPEYEQDRPQEQLTALWELVEERLSATGANTRGLVTKFLTH